MFPDFLSRRDKLQRLKNITLGQFHPAKPALEETVAESKLFP